MAQCPANQETLGLNTNTADHLSQLERIVVLADLGLLRQGLNCL